MPGSEFYLRAFWELNSDRQIGMALGQVPFSAIDRYAQRAGIEGEDFDYFVRMIRAMDKVMLEHSRAKAPGKAGKPRLASRKMSAGLFDAVFG